MIVQLLNVPQTEDEWYVWSFHHRLSHDAIRQAVLAQQNLNLTDYELDPIPSSAITDWLERNEQTHLDMNAAVGSQGSDLQSVDLTDVRQKESWIYLHYLEHQTAEQRLKIGT
jgi:hypothetical protein